MKIVRYAAGDGFPAYGVLKGDQIHRATGDLFSGLTAGGVAGSVHDVRLLAPLDPKKIVCVGLNYAAHVTERDATRKIPEEPVLFMKPTSSVIGPDETIHIANPQNQTDYEAELALVVGKTARDVPAANWREYIAGFTCANDVSDRTLQKKDGQWVRAKGFHTYCPVGPWIETELDLESAVVQSRLYGELRQNQAVSTMLLLGGAAVAAVAGIATTATAARMAMVRLSIGTSWGGCWDA